jgi:ankyrin repeat protein
MVFKATGLDKAFVVMVRERRMTSLAAEQTLRAHVININACDGMGRSALHWAVLHGDISLATVLIHHGARAALRDALGDSSVHVCVRHGTPALLEVLMHDRWWWLDINLPRGGQYSTDKTVIMSAITAECDAQHLYHIVRLLLEWCDSIDLSLTYRGLDACDWSTMRNTAEVRNMIHQYRRWSARKKFIGCFV